MALCYWQCIWNEPGISVNCIIQYLNKQLSIFHVDKTGAKITYMTPTYD